MQQKRKSSSSMFWLLLGVAALGGAYLFRGDGGGVGGGTYTSFANRRLPSIEAKGTWIHSESPLSWSTLGGKVVWLEFSFIH